MILPCPFAIMPGMTAFDTMNGDTTSMSSTSLYSATVISVMGMRRMIPALFTKMSIVPRSQAICATVAATCASSQTSQR